MSVPNECEGSTIQFHDSTSCLIVILITQDSDIHYTAKKCVMA